MTELTPRQQQILQWLRDFLARSGLPPTRAEMCRALGFKSPNAAEEHLRALARKGAIELVAGTSRGIRLSGAGRSLPSGLPVVGRVAAGSPLLAEENVEDHWAVAPELFRPKADYLLRVVGASMQGAGILDGDLLAVHRTPGGEARNGQIVVARLGDEVTVKRFRRRGSVVRLLPENPAFEPIQVDLSREPLVIEGLGVGVMRRLGG